MHREHIKEFCRRNYYYWALHLLSSFAAMKCDCQVVLLCNVQPISSYSHLLYISNPCGRHGIHSLCFQRGIVKGHFIHFTHHNEYLTACAKSFRVFFLMLPKWWHHLFGLESLHINVFSTLGKSDERTRMYFFGLLNTRFCHLPDPVSTFFTGCTVLYFRLCWYWGSHPVYGSSRFRSTL